MKKIHSTSRPETNRQIRGSRNCVLNPKICFKEINIFFPSNADKIPSFLDFRLDISEVGNIIF